MYVLEVESEISPVPVQGQPRPARNPPNAKASPWVVLLLLHSSTFCPPLRMHTYTYTKYGTYTRTSAVDGEVLAPHQLVDELRDELLGVLVGPVHVVPPRDDDGKVERPGQPLHAGHTKSGGSWGSTVDTHAHAQVGRYRPRRYSSSSGHTTW